MQRRRPRQPGPDRCPTTGGASGPVRIRCRSGFANLHRSERAPGQLLPYHAAVIHGGWHADPRRRHDLRYHDGEQWTDQVSDAGVTSTDAVDAAWSGPSEVCENGHLVPVEQLFCGVCGAAMRPRPHERNAVGSRGLSPALMVTVALVAVVIIGAAVAFASTSRGKPSASEAPTSTLATLPASSTSSTTATTLPVTTAATRPPLQQALELKALSVRPVRFPSESDSDIYIGFEMKNKTSEKIDAFQSVTELTVTDKLGQSYTKKLSSDCTEGPLRPMEKRVAAPIVQIVDINFKNCTYDVWSMNPFVESERLMFAALEGGAKTVAVVTPTRIAFAGGRIVTSP
jgi:hypothetical protein